MSERFRVLFVIANYPPRPGGAERHTQRLCNCLRARKNRIRVLTIRYPKCSSAEFPGEAYVSHFPTPSAPRWRDLVFALWVAASLPILRLRYRHVQWVMTGLQTVLGLPIAAALGMKNAIMLAGSGEGERLQFSARGRWTLRLMRRYADRIIILNSAMKRELESLGFEAERLVMLGCEANPARYRPAEAGEKEILRRPWKLASDAAVITYAGRLVPGKGLPTLLGAFSVLCSRQPGAVLMIAGDGPLAEDLRRQIARLGLSASVTMTGHLGESELCDLLRCTDIFAFPSESEGIPAAVVEAMATGLPTVVTDIPGTEIVVNGIHGLRVPVGNSEALASALHRLIAEPGLRNRMSSHARDFFLAHYTPDKVAEAHERMYEEILHTEPVPPSAQPHSREESTTPS